MDPAVLSIPGFGSYLQPPPAPGINSSQHVAPHPTASAPPASTTDSDDFQTKLEERKKAAEAIAAKFRALAGLPVGPAGIGGTGSDAGAADADE